jgi:hypothetical protein
VAGCRSRHEIVDPELPFRGDSVEKLHWRSFRVVISAGALR